jgi:hypothetical protein
MQSRDLTGGELSHLMPLSQLRQRVVHDDARIANGEDALLTNDLSVSIDLDPPRATDRYPQSRSADPRHPGRQMKDQLALRAVLEVNAISFHLGDRGFQPDVDATLDQLL